MADTLTIEQQKAVSYRGGDLLVSAAAGSGKTRVLVERLMQYILDPVAPANVDDFLIITYTKAAAAELREKIAKKITTLAAQMPENRHLQHQLQRLYLAKISTVHAFCTEVLRENGYMLDVFGDFRVAEENECEQLKNQVLDQLLEVSYAAIGTDRDFRSFVDSQGFGRDDRLVPEIIKDVYRSARCHLNPDEWLSGCVSDWQSGNITDISQTSWGAYLIEDLKETCKLHSAAITQAILEAEKDGNMEKPVALLRETLQLLADIASLSTWEEIHNFGIPEFGTLTFTKKADPMTKEKIKAVRNACKDTIREKLAVFATSNDNLLIDLAVNVSAVRGLVHLVEKFHECYTQVKNSRHIMDFSDLEHKTLDLLWGKNRRQITAAARELGERFIEVMVDEYQDSNAVQDAIFRALTDEKQNSFMVGDVKQSIYQFRLADPGIFLEKYNTFTPTDEGIDKGAKVLLSANFRSVSGVLSGVNDVFSECMSPNVGGLYYGEDEQLVSGLGETTASEPAVSLYAIDVDSDTYFEEAQVVADEISKILDGNHTVRDGETIRPAKPGDIAVLLRSPASVGGEFAYALMRRGIPCQFGKDQDLLQTEEVQVLRALLETLDNPLQDIPLVASMMSRLFAFTADEMAGIRKKDTKCPIFTLLERDESTRVVEFVSVLNSLRQAARLGTVSELLTEILRLTQIESVFKATGDGEAIEAFLQLATEVENMGRRDLRSFLDYLDALEGRGLKIEGGNSGDSVMITSIHKSKGLEYPIVFVSGLSKAFNREDLKDPVLCDKKLGLGLTCFDVGNRVRYPSVAKRAIALKKTKDSISEELRVLYVAMTRAKDSLIMTYASNCLGKKLSDIAQRKDYSPRELLTSEVSSMGDWVLQTAMGRIEAGELFAIGGRPDKLTIKEPYWRIEVRKADAAVSIVATEASLETESNAKLIVKEMSRKLAFSYPYKQATLTPSKETATQLKGREKDREAAEHTEVREHRFPLRKPSFVEKRMDSVTYGTVMHKALQYLLPKCCANREELDLAIQEMCGKGVFTAEEVAVINREHLWAFFSSALGRWITSNNEILREFKFSILTDGPDGEQILLQGVVDCAVIEPDGITVVDFKTDYVTDQTLTEVANRYKAQILAYAEALSRIFVKPIKKATLYFLHIGKDLPVL